MSKEKKTKSFEDGRQKIDVDYEVDSLQTQQPAKKKKKSASILTPVFLLFICIPIAFIVYFWSFYDPSGVGEQAKIEDNQVVEVAKNSSVTPPKNSAATESEDEEVLSEEEKTAAALAAQEAAEKAAKAEAERVAQKAAEQKAAEEAAEEERRKAEEEEARRQAAIEQERVQKQAAEAEARRQAEAAKKQEQQKQQTVRSHTVRESETLYRIAVNYYGSGDAVDRIKAANGLHSNEISVGQTLILP